MTNIKEMGDAVADLLGFIDRSPTPYHAVQESVRRLRVAGYQPLDETELWDLSPGDRRYVQRGGGSLLAFELGQRSPAEAGFCVLGAHTDSPNLRVKPLPDIQEQGYRQVSVEPYGGVLLHTWLDRDLSLAGRVQVREGTQLRSLLVDFERPLLRIPSLAIHLQRDVNSKGLKLDPQRHTLPLLGLEDAPPLPELLVTELRAQGLADVEARDLLGFDLMSYDTQASTVAGARGEFIQAPRIDNLSSCHASICALTQAGDSERAATRAMVLYDHEEVGSRSASGAAGPLLAESLERIVGGFKGGSPQGLPRALARSTLISVDMAHAVHPNHADRHDPGHRPVVGRGPVIKVNANQSYSSDAQTAGDFRAICEQEGIRPQYFASRSDLACGSTIGPISAARTGLATVDIGNPMLSMHSCREQAGSGDVEPMLAVLRRFLAGPEAP